MSIRQIKGPPNPYFGLILPCIRGGLCLINAPYVGGAIAAEMYMHRQETMRRYFNAGKPHRESGGAYAHRLPDFFQGEVKGRRGEKKNADGASDTKPRPELMGVHGMDDHVCPRKACVCHGNTRRTAVCSGHGRQRVPVPHATSHRIANGPSSPPARAALVTDCPNISRARPLSSDVGAQTVIHCTPPQNPLEIRHQSVSISR